MTSRLCLLHVGAPKAGSTTIQGFLHLNQAALATRGVDVPLFPENDVVKGGIALTSALDRETDPAAPATPSWRWLDRRLAETTGDLCISRESLCMHFAHPQQLTFAQGFFERRGVRLKLLAYVRDSVGFLNATYTQNAKKLRLSESFESWIEPILAEPPRRYDYWRMFRHMAAHDGPEIAIEPLAALGPAGLLGNLLDHLGCGDLDASAFDDAPFRNATPGPKAIAAALRVGRALKERGIDARASPKLVQAFAATIADRGWTERPFYGPDPGLARRIADRFVEGNDRLAHIAWGAGWEARAPVRPQARNVFRYETANAAERTEVDDLSDRFVRRFVDRSFWSRLLGRSAVA